MISVILPLISTSGIVWIVIGAIVVILVLWVISVQNKLVQQDEFCNNSLKQISVQQTTRYDALLTNIKLAREYAKYEGDAFEKIIAQRGITTSPNPTVAEINSNEQVLRQMSAGLYAVSERYPELKANEGFQKTRETYNKYEEMVRLSRMTFNDTVTKFNNQVRMFPGSVIASMLGFSRRDYLADNPEKVDIPDF